MTFCASLGHLGLNIFDYLFLNYPHDPGQKEYLSLAPKLVNLCLLQEVLHLALCSKCKLLNCQCMQKQLVLKQYPPTQQSTLYFKSVTGEVVRQLQFYIHSKVS
jgi:hypothetical protein